MHCSVSDDHLVVSPGHSLAANQVIWTSIPPFANSNRLGFVPYCSRIPHVFVPQFQHALQHLWLGLGQVVRLSWVLDNVVQLPCAVVSTTRIGPDMQDLPLALAQSCNMVNPSFPSLESKLVLPARPKSSHPYAGSSSV